MEETLQHKAAPQCSGLSPASAGNHHLDGLQANDALTINLDQSDEAAQCKCFRNHLPTISIFSTFSFDVRPEDIQASVLPDKVGQAISDFWIVHEFCAEKRIVGISVASTSRRADHNTLKHSNTLRA